MDKPTDHLRGDIFIYNSSVGTKQFPSPALSEERITADWPEMGGLGWRFKSGSNAATETQSKSGMPGSSRLLHSASLRLGVLSV
jgi:hypothetical protein